MRFVSTRGGVPATAFADAVAAGLAPDGGLFVPERLPTLEREAFDGAQRLADIAAVLLRPFVVDPSGADGIGFGDDDLRAMLREAFTFEVPLTTVDARTSMLELFHGPTAAFKDVGARFLAACLARVHAKDGRARTVLVATSGDTGGAVADAFFERPGFTVVILFPDGLVSPRQAHLLSCYGGNVRTLRVQGTFDDCQRLVKQAFTDRELARRCLLTSANSISLGRLLPQMVYYASTALRFFASHGERLNFVVPTGNLGNALACVYARAIGLPIGDVVLATNENRVLPEFFAGGAYAPRASVATLANAMDVGDPSNFERLRHLFPDAADLRLRLRAEAVSDAEIRAAIVAWHARHGSALCPHAATGAVALARLRARGDTRPWCVVATAHPAKFDTVVEPLIGRQLAPPAPLARLLARAAHSEALSADYAAFRACVAK